MKKNTESASKTVNVNVDLPRVTRPELRRGVMGKYFHEYHGRGSKPLIAIALEEDVAAVFKDSKSVNSVLRAIIKNVPQLTTMKRRKSA